MAVRPASAAALPTEGLRPVDLCPESVHIWWMAHADDRQMDIVRERFETLSPHPAGKDRRLLAAFEARSLCYGGISRVSEATGVARSTIGRGLKIGNFRDAGRT